MEIQMDFEKKILNGIEGIESITAENSKELLDTTKESAISEVRSMLKFSIKFVTLKLFANHHEISIYFMIFFLSLMRKKWVTMI